MCCITVELTIFAKLLIYQKSVSRIDLYRIKFSEKFRVKSYSLE